MIEFSYKVCECVCVYGSVEQHNSTSKTRFEVDTTVCRNDDSVSSPLQMNESTNLNLDSLCANR